MAKKARSSHNEIEKRYRENINERMRELRDVVPALAAIAANEGDGGMDEDDGIAANKAGSGNAAKKLHKAAILKGATDHIRHLTLENDRLRIELNSLRGLLASAAASVSVPGWHAQPMSTTSVGDPEAPAGTVAPISIMILAGVMFLGRAGSVPEVLSLGPESPALGSHTDVGKVLGVNGTGFGFANTSQPFDDNLLSWIGNLVRLLLALYCVMHILLSVFVFPKKGRKCETNAREMGNGVGVDARRCSSQVAAVVNAAAQLALSGKFDESAGLFERATGIAATDADCSDHAWLVRDPDLAREFWVSRSWSAEVADSETTADVFTVTGLAFRQWMLRRALIAALKATVSGSLETSFTSPELICRNLVYDCEVNKDVSVLPAAMVARAVLAACCGAPSSDVTKATTLAVEHSKEYYLASFGAAVSVTLIAMRGGCEDARRKALIAAQQAVAACAARRRHSVRSSRANSLNHSVDLVLELFLCVALAVCIKSDIVLEEPSLDLLSAHILRLLAATPSNMKADVEPVLSFVESMIV